MNQTKILFESRKEEIENLYEDLIASNEGNNPSLVTILKSSLVIMLYSLMEACLTEGLREIYEVIPYSFPTHENLCEELVGRWVSKVVKDARRKPDEYLPTLMQQLISKPASTIDIGKVEDLKDISNGNLDKKHIKEIFDNHGIPTTNSWKRGVGKYTDYVKERRNKLSHGEESFSQSMRECPIESVDERQRSVIKIKKDVFNYMASVIDDMDDFYTNRLYLKQIETENMEEGLI